MSSADSDNLKIEIHDWLAQARHAPKWWTPAVFLVVICLSLTSLRIRTRANPDGPNNKTDGQAGRLTDRQTGRQERQTSRETDRQTARQPGRQAGRPGQADRQAANRTAGQPDRRTAPASQQTRRSRRDTPHGLWVWQASYIASNFFNIFTCSAI